MRQPGWFLIRPPRQAANVGADTKFTLSVPTSCDPAQWPWTRCWSRDSSRQWQL